MPAEFQRMAKALNASNDDFIRTTEKRHYAASQAIWKAMAANGDIYKGGYAGWYSVRDEAYYGEEETEVRADNVRYGPQGTPVEWVEEESYFFRLSAYQDRLLALYESQPDFIGPAERRNEVVSFVKSGLKDLSISRTTFDWGVPVPGDEKHVMYVWVDALTNYITAAGYPDEKAERWRYWPADAHIIGKDIVRFHAVYWPAFLWSAGIELPKRVFGHGFVFNRGEKMSKSVGNVIDPFALVEHYGLDQVRYFLLREVPFGQDGNYSHEAIVNRTNADLANDLGNLAQRSLSMIAKNCGGLVPAKGKLAEADDGDPAAGSRRAGRRRARRWREQAIHQALAAIFGVVAEANRYFAGQEPWALRKNDPARMETVLWTTAEIAAADRHTLPALHAGLGREAARPSGGAGRRAEFRACRRQARAGVRARRCRRPRRCSRAMSSRPKKPEARRCSSTATAISISPISPRNGRQWLRARRPPASAHMVTISTRVKRFGQVLAIAEEFDSVFCSVGTHPHNAAEELDVTADELVRLSAHPKVVAIGEAGLDYHYDKSPRDAQMQGFRTHIAAARQTGLPLVIHARSADDDIAATLEEETGKGAFPFVLHCFSSGRELARTGVKLGGYVSFSGILTFKNSEELRSIAAEVPHDRLLVETDAPYLAPVPYARQAQRAVLCGPHGEGSCRDDRRKPRKNIGNHHREFLPACSRRCRGSAGRAPEPWPIAALHGARLRLVAGHAAHHRRLGQLRSRATRRTGARGRRRWSSALPKTAA